MPMWRGNQQGRQVGLALRSEKYRRFVTATRHHATAPLGAAVSARKRGLGCAFRGLARRRAVAGACLRRVRFVGYCRCGLLAVMGVRLLSLAVLFAFAVRAMERAVLAAGFGDKQPRGQRAQRENTQHKNQCQKRATQSQMKRHCGENDCPPILSQARTKKLHRIDGFFNAFRIIADGAPSFVGSKTACPTGFQSGPQQTSPAPRWRASGLGIGSEGS